MIRTSKLASFALGMATLGFAVVGGCKSDGASDQSRPMADGMSNGMSDGGKPLEGNPGATTGPSAGYPKSDSSGYHPASDDVNRYHPADPAAIQPGR